MNADQERPLDPPDDDIDYDREEERIEQARADEIDDTWDRKEKAIADEVTRFIFENKGFVE